MVVHLEILLDILKTAVEVIETSMQSKDIKMNTTKFSKRSYPFLSRAEVAARIQDDSEFALHCFAIMCAYQTADERLQGQTIVKNRQGFSSSDSLKVTRLAAEMAERGAPVDPLTLDFLRVTEPDQKLEIVHFLRTSLQAGRGLQGYSKQIAAYFRSVAINMNPELAAQTEHFFRK